MKGWKTAKLGEVCDVLSGFAFRSKEYTDDGFFLIRIGNVQGGCLNLDSPKFVQLDSRTRKFELQPDDLLISLTGNIGRAARVEPSHLPAALNQRVARLRVATAERADVDFLYFFFQSSAFRDGLLQSGHGVAQLNVSPKAIGELLVPLPPLPEQERIVEILDEAFAAIATATANAEKNLANARELFESELNWAFTRKASEWPAVPLESIGQLQTGSTPRTSDSGNKGNHIPFIKPGHFEGDGSLDYENEGLSELGLRGSRLIPSGSALMVCIGATIGKAGYADRNIAANQQINAVTPRPGISGKFIYYQMLSQRLQRQVKTNAGQATLPIISKSKWGKLMCHVPPRAEEQTSVVNHFDDLSRATIALRSIYETRLARLAELKQSILHQAFTGKLTAGPRQLEFDLA